MSNENLTYELESSEYNGLTGITEVIESEKTLWTPIDYPINFTSSSLTYRAKPILPAVSVPTDKTYYWCSEAGFYASLSIKKGDSFETFEPHASYLKINLEIKIAETEEQKSLGAILSGGGKTYERQQGFFHVRETPHIYLCVFLNEHDFADLVQKFYEPSFNHLSIQLRSKCIYCNEVFGDISGYKILLADQWEDYGLASSSPSPSLLDPNERVNVSIQTVFDTAGKADAVLEELKKSISRRQYISIHTDTIDKIEEAVLKANRVSFQESNHDLGSAMSIYVNHLSSRIMSASNQIAYLLILLSLIAIIIAFLLY